MEGLGGNTEIETQDRFLAVIGGLGLERQQEIATLAGQSMALESADSGKALESLANRSISGDFEGGEATLLGKPERSALAFIAVFGAVAFGIWAFVEVTESTATESRELWFMGTLVAMMLFFSFLMVSGFKKVKMSITSGTDADDQEEEDDEAED